MSEVEAGRKDAIESIKESIDRPDSVEPDTA